MNIRTISTGLFCRVLCVILAIAMATGPSANAWAQTNAAAQAVRKRVEGLDGRGGETQPPEQGSEQPPGQPQPRSRKPPERTRTTERVPAGGRMDTTYVLPRAVAFAALRPSQLFKAPMAEWLPTEVATAAGLKYLGIDPAEVDEVIAFCGVPSVGMEYGITLKFAKPFKGSSIPQELRAHAQPGEIDGRKYLQSTQPMLPSFFAPDTNTLVVAPDETLKQLVAGKKERKTGPLLDRVAAAPGGNDLYLAVDIESLRPMIALAMAQATQKIPPQAQPFLDAPNLIRAAELTFNLNGNRNSSLVVRANDEASAQQLETLLANARSQYQEQMKAQFAEQAASSDPVDQALAQYMDRVSGLWMTPFTPTRETDSLTLFRTDSRDPAQQQLTNVAVVGVLVALLLPAVQAAREAARRSQAANGLKELMLASLFYESVNKTYPAHASYSADGRPLLSWRVHILPFLQEEALYKEFHLDEPWDSPHNSQLIPRMPKVYECANAPLEPGKTIYLAIVGEPCIFDGTANGMKISKVTDGTSNTIVLVEANPDRAVEWTKPEDLTYDASNPAAGLGGLRPNGWNAAFADGSVKFINNNVDPQIINALFTRGGGEPIGPQPGSEPGGPPVPVQVEERR